MAETEVEQLRRTVDALRPYARHTKSCDLDHPQWISATTLTKPPRLRTKDDPPATCTCGLAAVLRELSVHA